MSAKEIQLNKEETFLFISEVQKRPILWKGNTTNVSSRVRNKMWKEINRIIFNGDETKAASLKSKWYNLRTSYVKHRNKPPNAAKHTHKYKYAKELRFLDTVILPNENPNNAILTPTNTENDIKNFLNSPSVLGKAESLPVESQNRLKTAFLNFFIQEESSSSRSIPSATEAISSGNSFDFDDSMQQEQSTVKFDFDTSGAQASNIAVNIDGKSGTAVTSIPDVALTCTAIGAPSCNCYFDKNLGIITEIPLEGYGCESMDLVPLPPLFDDPLLPMNVDNSDLHDLLDNIDPSTNVVQSNTYLQL